MRQNRTFSFGLSFPLFIYFSFLILAWALSNFAINAENFLSRVRGEISAASVFGFFSLVTYFDLFWQWAMKKKRRGRMSQELARVKKKGEDYYVLYLQNQHWKMSKAYTGCSQIGKTSGSRRASTWKIDSQALKKPLKQECGDDLFYNALRVRGGICDSEAGLWLRATFSPFFYSRWKGMRARRQRAGTFSLCQGGGGGEWNVMLGWLWPRRAMQKYFFLHKSFFQYRSVVPSNRQSGL